MTLILQIVAAIATILTGLYSLLFPRRVFGFTGLTAEGGRGITEIRAVLGAFFIGLGAAALGYGGIAYDMLGIAYLVVAVVRAFSMFYDQSIERSNIISVGTELLLGIMLLLP
ncbi:MAG: hypothetical protein GX557_08605 [Chloroflexi bacterium]|nr:hypothetical protein [Chloroflexota bacterium]